MHFYGSSSLTRYVAGDGHRRSSPLSSGYTAARYLPMMSMPQIRLCRTSCAASTRTMPPRTAYQHISGHVLRINCERGTWEELGWIRAAFSPTLLCRQKIYLSVRWMMTIAVWPSAADFMGCSLQLCWGPVYCARPCLSRFGYVGASVGGWLLPLNYLSATGALWRVLPGQRRRPPPYSFLVVLAIVSVVCHG